MRKDNFRSESEKEIMKLAQQYEQAKKSEKPAYMDSEDLADLADWYATNGDHDSALEVCRYGLRIHPHNSSLLREIAYVYLDEDNVGKARSAADEISEQDLQEVRILQAHVCMAEGDEQGMERIIKGIEAYDSVQNLVEVAYLYSDSNMAQRGINLLMTMKEEWGGEEPFLACMGDCCRASGRYKEAIDNYNQLLDIDPYNPYYWCALAWANVSLGRYDKAIEACDYAIVIDEDYNEAYMLRAHAYFAIGNEEEAMKDFKEVYDRKGMSPQTIRAMQAIELTKAGNWAEALKLLEDVIHTVSEDFDLLAVVYAHAALCQYRLGHPRKAHNYCKKAKELDPDELEAYLTEGRIFMEEGKYEKAVRDWEEAVDIDPSASTWNDIGNFCLDSGALEHAQYAFEQVIRIEPDYDGICERLTVVSIMLGDQEGFKKYNKLCANPIDINNLEGPLKSLDEEGMGWMLRNALNALKRKMG